MRGSRIDNRFLAQISGDGLPEIPQSITQAKLAFAYRR
jgi:hypothetical protein